MGRGHTLYRPIVPGQPCTEVEGRTQRLAREILQRAILDARGDIFGARSKDEATNKLLQKRIRLEAQVWLTVPNACLCVVCEMAGINMDVMVAKARREFGEHDAGEYREGADGRQIGDSRKTKADSVCKCGLREYVLDGHGRAVL